MDDAYLLRYSRQIMLRGIDVEGQDKLLSSRVLLVGLGGLGSPIAMYLAASGVGHLVLVDHDRVAPRPTCSARSCTPPPRASASPRWYLPSRH